MKPTPVITNHDLDITVTCLNTLLADEYAFYTKTRNAHRNIKGSTLLELQKILETQSEGLDIMIDDIAKRVRSLGHFAPGPLKDFLSVRHIAEENHHFNNTKQIIQTRVNDHKTIFGIIRDDITPVSGKYKDPDIGDFVTGLMEQHEKMARRLKSYLS